MGELYLTSRAEILRKVDMDTGRKIALVAAEPGFLRWIEKLLPSDTCIAGDPDELGDRSLFDIIIYWEKENVRMDRIEKMIDLLSQKGDLWIIVKHGPDKDLLAKRFGVKDSMVLTLTPDRDLMPLIIRYT